MLDRLPHMTQLPAADMVCGIWQVRRTVVDHRAGAVYSFSGRAEITRDLFEERGEMAVGGNVLQAVRTYGLVFEDDAVRLLYPGGGEFIRLGYGVSQRVSHLCGNDFYAGRFLFRDRDSWAEVWRVHGPQKQYSSLSRYVRGSTSSP
jgi:hypothetical protein